MVRLLECIKKESIKDYKSLNVKTMADYKARLESVKELKPPNAEKMLDFESDG